jgi:hypothetical protein
MQITLAADPTWQACATDAGFASIEAYLCHLVGQDISERNDPQPAPLPRVEWQRQLESLLQLAEPGNPELDDTREGIYADRIAKLTAHADPR